MGLLRIPNYRMALLKFINTVRKKKPTKILKKGDLSEVNSVAGLEQQSELAGDFNADLNQIDEGDDVDPSAKSRIDGHRLVAGSFRVILQIRSMKRCMVMRVR